MPLSDELQKSLAEADPELSSDVTPFLMAVTSILEAKQMPFFRAYTDHGIEHVRSVLRAAVELVPPGVELSGEDIAALLCATALHDFAMHLHEHQLAAIVTGNWSPDPKWALPGDRPWPLLWDEFQFEARHFGDGRLKAILGATHRGVPEVARADFDFESESLGDHDKLLVGEFLRRHHPRLAYEFALNGLPNVSHEAFPVLARVRPELARVIGLIARSHGEPLRPIAAQCEALAPQQRKQAGVRGQYLMALLRIADYIQLEASRAPRTLLEMIAPTSPVSEGEWHKHGVVGPLEWGAEDTDAIFVPINPKHDLGTHLQLRALLQQIQVEMDVTAAVLSEVYDREDERPLRLKWVRLVSDLDSEQALKELPYVPVEARLHSAADLFRRVVGALYGEEPSIAGRELIQNAVDAVRARRHAEKKASGRHSTSGEPDVEVTFKRTGGGATLTVRDRGIGMDAEAITNYFLSAGASRGLALADAGEQGVAYMQAGRFGIGVLACFLLKGESVEVATRKLGQDRGLRFTVGFNSDFVELRHADDLEVGTEIAVPFELGELPSQFTGEHPDMLRHLAVKTKDWYRLADPRVSIRIEDGIHSATIDLPADVPDPNGTPHPEWHEIEFEGFDAILWSHRLQEDASDKQGFVVHNGIAIDAREGYPPGPARYRWAPSDPKPLVKRPQLAIFDSQHRLGLTLNRYALERRELPFEAELQRGIGVDILALALMAGSDERHPLLTQHAATPVYGAEDWHPMLPSLLAAYANYLLVLWTPSTDQESGAESPGVPVPSFLEGETAFNWDEGTRRAVIGANLPEQWGDDRQLDVTLRRIVDAASNLCYALELSFVTSVFAQPGVSVVGRPSNDWLPEVLPGVGRLWRITDKDAADEVKALLSDAAGALTRQPDCTGAVGLTLFRTAGGGSPIDAELAAPWSETLYGPIPRDQAARRRLANAASRNPRMRKALEKRGWSPEG